MSPPDLPPTFQALETRLVDLQARYQRGELDASAYQAAVQELKVQDHLGRTWWLGGEQGAWHLWDGREWVRGEPQVREAVEDKAIKPRGMQLIRPFALGCGLSVFILALAAGIFLIVGWQAYQQEPLIVEGITPREISSSQFALSSDQQAVVDRHGYPDAFAILFYEEEQVDGSIIDVRFETWSYYTVGLEYTFFNGAQEAEDLIEIDLVGELAPISYQPEQFVAYMSLDEIVASADLETYMVIPLEKEYLEDGEVYYAEKLTFGLMDGELLYVEALALELES